MSRLNLQAVYDRVSINNQKVYVQESQQKTVTINCARCDWHCVTDSNEEEVVKKIRIHCIVNKGRHIISVD